MSFDILSVVTNLDASVKITVEQSNLYAQRNGKEFQTNKEDVKAFWESTFSRLLIKNRLSEVNGNVGITLDNIENLKHKI